MKGQGMKPTQFLAALMAATLMTAAPGAHAHGDRRHAPKTDTVAEQTDWGIAGQPEQVARTISLDMTDAMRFTLEHIVVQQGDTVRFVVRNRGRMLHEMVIGSPDELVKHAVMMAKFPNMVHDEAYMAHVGPGETGEIVWHFNRAGSFEFACLIAGHYEAGMRGTLTVTPEQGDEK